MPEASTIRQAFEASIEVFGEATKRTLIEDLRRLGIHLNDPDITLSRVVTGLRQIVGEEASNLLIERVFIKLDELHSIENSRQ